MRIDQKLHKHLEKFEILSVNSVSRFTFHRFEGFSGHHRRCCGRPRWGFCPAGGGEGSAGRRGATPVGGDWALSKTEKQCFSGNLSIYAVSGVVPVDFLDAILRVPYRNLSPTD